MSIIQIVKDLGPILISIIALLLASKHITKQARLSAKNQWIQEFRSNTVKLLTKHFEFSKSYKYPEQTYSLIAYKDLMEQIYILSILLNNNSIIQCKLNEDLNDLITLIKMSELNMITINNRIGFIYNNCKKLIDDESEKI